MTKYWDCLTDEGKTIVLVTGLFVEWFLLFGLMV